MVMGSHCYGHGYELKVMDIWPVNVWSYLCHGDCTDIITIMTITVHLN